MVPSSAETHSLSHWPSAYAQAVWVLYSGRNWTIDGTAGWLPLEPFLLSHGENKWDNSDPSVKILVVCLTGLSVAARYNAFESSSGDSVSLT